LPRDILIIGGGAGGLIYEVLKHPEVKIDYTELDPGIIDALRRYPDQLTTRELNSPRLTLIKTDGRFFLQNTRRQYDLILIGVSRLSDLTEGRLFTKEFFDLTKKHLMSGGILALCLAGSPVYLSQDLKGINAALFNSLALTYPYLRIIPGDYNLHFASNRQEILEVTSSILTDRIVSRKIRTGLLVPEYLDYRLDPQKASWLIQSLSTVTKRTNQDLRPYAVFKTLVFWNRKFSPRLAGLLNSLENIGLGQMMAIIFILTAILLLLVRRLKQPMKLTLGWSIFTTGFFGMMVSLMLIFAFQVYTGYLYYKIGLLVSLFMVGSALGSIFIARMGNDPRRTKINFAWLELMILIFAFLCAGAIYALAHQAILGLMFFGLLSFASGLSLGLEFALASKIYLGERAKLGYACAALYGADLLGGWVAGITGGVFFLPILGIFNTCVTLALFKLSSLFLYLYGQNFSLAPKNQGVS
jgi:spermidine synthase